MYRTDYQDYLNADGSFIMDWLDWMEKQELIEKEEQQRTERIIKEEWEQMTLELGA